MKKSIVLLFMLGAVILFAQNTDIETVREIQAEREMANWIESMLYPIVGDNVAIVDMTLRYPSEKLKVFGSTLDTERSLPGLPVARSSGVMPSEVAGEETYPTIILSKVVTIYLSKNTTEEMENFVRQNVMSWANIDEDKGDGLEVKRVLNLKADELIDEENESAMDEEDYKNYILIIGAVLLLIILIFIIIFSLRMQALAKSLKEVNIPGLENAINPFVHSPNSKRDFISDKAIDVRIMPEEKEKKEVLSFEFLENLSITGFARIIMNENPEHAAYILSQLSSGYSGKFFDHCGQESKGILKAAINMKPIAHNEITKLHSKMQKLYHHTTEEEGLSYDAGEFISNLINSQSVKGSKVIFQQVSALDTKFADQLRKQVFLLEDIINLDQVQLQLIIRQIDRSLLIRYLSICSEAVRIMFFDAMTRRNQEIVKEEMEHLKEFSPEEIADIENQVLDAIRSVLGKV